MPVLYLWGRERKEYPYAFHDSGEPSQYLLKVFLVVTLTNKHMLKASAACEPNFFQESFEVLQIILAMRIIRRK